jgi:23S rRNA-/tRNA-specific pseudouridylate synthase
MAVRHSNWHSLSSSKSSSILSHSGGGSRRHEFPRSPCRLLATLSSSEVDAQQLLMDPIRKAYAERETDGILELAATQPSFSMEQVRPADLVQASLQAFQQDSAGNARKNKGKVAGVLNAWIGSCNLQEDASLAADYALQLLEAYDALTENDTTDKNAQQENAAPQPDMVTLCLVYACVYRHDPEQAASILERAARASKKSAGSQRRKAMAAARRKPVAHRLLANSSEKDNDDDNSSVEASSALLDELQRLIPNLDVLAETDDYIMFQNPSGTACYHTHTTTAGKIKGGQRKKKQRGGGGGSANINNKQQQDIALEDALLHINLPLSTLNAECRGLVHRLDRGTSGCMIWAKSDHMHALLVTEFFLRRVQKTYTTLVVTTNDNDSDSDSHILADEGRVSLPVDGRPAESTYRVLERYGTEAALVQVRTMTGRKHQVRVHCAQGLSSPVVRDTLYGDAATVCPAWSEVDADKDADNGPQHQERFLLHASSLSIPALHLHTTEAPLPSWWTPILDNLQGVSSQ